MDLPDEPESLIYIDIALFHLFLNIVDYNRVHLDEEPNRSDYINASFICVSLNQLN